MMAFRSLRAQLSFWLMAPLVVFAGLDAWITYRSAQETASLVQERMLLGAARMMGEQVSLEEGVVQVDIPPSALELFASPSQDRVYYRISNADHQLLAGYPDLAFPPHQPEPEQALYFDAMLRERAVHGVVFAQPLRGAPGLVLIEVAQTLEGRDSLVQEIWGSAVRRQVAMLLMVAIFLWLGLRYATQPLITLRNLMRERRPGTLEPLAHERLPSELQPLVGALNDYVDRLNRHMSSHSRFIADASHQLRTPLTLLNTQVVYALRDKDAQVREEALVAMHLGVQHGIRLVNQLLAFSRAEAGLGYPERQSPVDLAEVVQRALEALATLAQQRQIDLGFAPPQDRMQILISPQMAYELVANLVDNALRYTPTGGVVTAHISRQGNKQDGVNVSSATVLCIEDNGPGIAMAEREKVFERFYRLNESQSDGCGLGLPIAREIAKSCGATISLLTPPSGQGLMVQVIFPD
jgi:two-component system, OmpR family, sensor histidine kinase TctE